MVMSNVDLDKILNDSDSDDDVGGGATSAASPPRPTPARSGGAQHPPTPLAPSDTAPEPPSTEPQSRARDESKRATGGSNAAVGSAGTSPRDRDPLAGRAVGGRRVKTDRTRSELELEKLLVDSRKLLGKSGGVGLILEDASIDKLIESDSDDDAQDMGAVPRQDYTQMLDQILADSDDDDEGLGTATGGVPMSPSAAIVSSGVGLGRSSPTPSDSKAIQEILAEINEKPMTRRRPSVFGRRPSVITGSFDAADLSINMKSSDSIARVETSEVDGLRISAVEDEDVEEHPSVTCESDPIRRLEAVERRMAVKGDRHIFTPLRDRRTPKPGSSPANARGAAANHDLMSCSERPALFAAIRREKEAVGIPTCVAVGGSTTAIGTSYGFALLFDARQKLICPRLGSISNVKTQGKVTSMSLSPDGNFLAVGHKKGQVALWDIARRAVVKTATDVFSGAVVGVHFTQDFSRSRTHRMIAHDVKGNVYLITMQKGMFFNWSVTKTYLLGETKTRDASAQNTVASPLVPTPDLKLPSDDTGVVALCNSEAIMFLGTEGRPSVLKRLPHAGGAPTDGSALAWVTAPAGQTATGQTKGSAAAEASGNTVAKLIVARSNMLRVISMSATPAGTDEFKLTFEVLCDVDLRPLGIERSLCAAWLGRGPNAVLAVSGDTKAQRRSLVVYDPTQKERLQSLELPELDLIFNADLGGSEDSSSAVYQNSVQTTPNGGFTFLALDRVVEARTLSWSERIDVHKNKGKWIHALALALDFSEGTARAPVGLGRASNGQPNRDAVIEKAEALLLQYVDLALGRFHVSRPSQIKDVSHFRVVGGVVIDYCLVIGREDLLFDQIFQKFTAAGGHTVLLELLEPFILNKRISSLPKAIIKRFSAHYITTRKSLRFAQCILHMNPAKMDAGALLTACRDHNAWSAMIHCFNGAQSNDFSTPVLELHRASTRLISNPKRARTNSYRLVRYVARCFRGKKYHNDDDIDPTRRDRVTAQVISVLFEKRPYQAESKSSSSSSLPPSTDTPYPILNHLLQLNAKLLLSTLDLILESPQDMGWVEFQGTRADRKARRQAKQRQQQQQKESTSATGQPAAAARVTPSSPDKVGTKDYVPTPQQMLDVLISLAADGTGTAGARGSINMDSPQRRELNMFAARHTATGLVKGEPGLIVHVVDYLLAEGKGSMSIERKDESEQFLVSLLGKVDPGIYDSRSLLDKTEAAGFHRVRVFLFRQQGDYLKMLGEYLHDVKKRRNARQREAKATATSASGAAAAATTARKPLPDKSGPADNDGTKSTAEATDGNGSRELFAFVRSVLSDGDGGRVSKRALAEFRSAILERITELMLAEKAAAAQLVVDFYSNEPENVVKRLDSAPRLQFFILRCLMDARDDREETDEQMRKRKSRISQAAYAAAAAAAAAGDDDAMPTIEVPDPLERIELSTELHKTYIRLLCQFEPESVYTHITGIHDYDIDAILDLCRQYKINDATAYLLQRVGDTQGALDLSLAEADRLMNDLKQRLRKQIFLLQDVKSLKCSGIPEHARVEAVLRVAAERIKGSVDARALWFRLLDHVVKQGVKESTGDANIRAMSQSQSDFYQKCVGVCAQLILREMAQDVPLGEIVRTLVTTYGSYHVVDFGRGTLQGILDELDHQVAVRTTANTLQRTDIYEQMREHVSCLSRAVSLSSTASKKRRGGQPPRALARNGRLKMRLWDREIEGWANPSQYADQTTRKSGRGGGRQSKAPNDRVRLSLRPSRPYASKRVRSGFVAAAAAAKKFGAARSAIGKGATSGGGAIKKDPILPKLV